MKPPPGKLVVSYYLVSARHVLLYSVSLAEVFVLDYLFLTANK